MAKSLERTHREETKLFGYNARAAVALKRFTELNKERETKAQENDRILREKRCLHFGVFYAAPPRKPMREFKKKSLHPSRRVHPADIWNTYYSIEPQQRLTTRKFTGQSATSLAATSGENRCLT